MSSFSSFIDGYNKGNFETNSDKILYHRKEIIKDLESLNIDISSILLKYDYSNITDFYILGDFIRKNISKIKSKDIIYNYLCLANILQNKDIVDKATEVANLYKL